MLILAIVAAPVYFGSVFMRETYKEQILRQRFLALGLGSRLVKRKVSRVLWISATRTFLMMLTEPMVFALSLYTSFAFSIIFVFFDIFPIMFQIVYGFDQEQVGSVYLSFIVGFLLSSINFLILFQLSTHRTSLGALQPEINLYSALIGSTFLPGSLFW